MANGNLNPLSVPIPIFTGRKYDTWRIKMETNFLSQDLWDIVNEGISIPESTSTLSEQQQKQLKESSQKNAAALYILQQAVEDDIFSKIYAVKTAKEAWTALKEKFQGNTQPTALSDEDKEKVEAECKKHLPLYQAILKGNIGTVRELCDKDKDALKARITVNWDTALHVAVGIGTGKAYDVVEYLLDKMSIGDQQLAWENKAGNTILSIAAIVGNIPAASMILHKDIYKTLILDPNNPKRMPLIEAARHGQKKMIKYLLPFSNGYLDYADLTRFSDGSGFSFLNSLIIAGFYEKRETDQALQLVKHLCMEIAKSSDHSSILKGPFLLAAELGVCEVMEEIIESYPDAIWFTNENNHNILHLAVMNRQKKVLRLISGRSGYKHMLLQSQDIDKNNVLHLAGKPKSKSNQLSSAALNMQQELQWFKVRLLM
ncbi:hypothetical protein Pint_11955 [Pistacia integerrima]|uniref:Uncharacterized protein n=1 Tax=Pistacia integerrima TaxID=434235 RepID=A0ACC0XJ57_9ROSI|nr:hypothetical protein Pint_11955 [Pistacia integerrima]